MLAAEVPDTPVVTFTLPENAANLQVETSEFAILELPEGFGVETIYPSDSSPYQILYSFDLPYEADQVTFDFPLAMDTTSAIVLSPKEGVEIKSDQLADAGMRDIEGVSYNLYQGSQLNAGETLTLTVAGQPEAPAAPAGETESTTTGLMIGLLAFGGVLIAAGIYLWWRSRADGAADAPLPAASPEEIMDAIITLDDLYKNGEIPDIPYKQRRAELKTQLQALIADD